MALCGIQCRKCYPVVIVPVKQTPQEIAQTAKRKAEEIVKAVKRVKI